MDERYGTIDDFDRFVREANRREMDVILDLVAHHTSDEHRRFEQARNDPDSPYRPAVLARALVPRPRRPALVPVVDDRDRRHAHAQVRDEILQIMRFWLERGVVGFRMAALMFLSEKAGAAYGGDRFPFVNEMQVLIGEYRPEGVVPAEAGVTPRDFQGFATKGADLILNFAMAACIFVALARQAARPVTDLLGQLSTERSFGIFLRNHDELTFDGISFADRRAVLDGLNVGEDRLLCERGVRRRVAPLLFNDRRRIELANAMMSPLPGTPILRACEEIGMGDDLSLPERQSVCTVMQWTAGRHGRSQLNWFRPLISARKSAPEIGDGRIHLLPVDDRSVLAVGHERGGSNIVAVLNLSEEPRTVDVGFDVRAGEELLRDERSRDPNGSPDHVSLSGFGDRWIRLDDA